MRSKVKLWEEEWGYRSVRSGKGVKWVVSTEGFPSMTEPRARLASAAPDMARALLAAEWGTSGQCPSCCVQAPGPHADDCALDAALVKAGVR